MENLIAEISTAIDATAAQVWKAITTPELIKQYLFGTEVTTDWKVGSPINYKGEYNGEEYHDKGTIQKLEPEKIFQSTYWSSMGGKEDKPENYNQVTYALSPEGDKTKVKITQDNVNSEKEKQHATQNWQMVLEGLKKVAESL